MSMTPKYRVMKRGFSSSITQTRSHSKILSPAKLESGSRRLRSGSDAKIGPNDGASPEAISGFGLTNKSLTHSFADEIALAAQDAVSDKVFRGGYLRKFLLQNRLILMLLCLTCIFSLFVSFYVDIKILELFNDPAISRTTPARIPPHVSSHFNLNANIKNNGDVLRAANELDMDAQLIRDLLNITRPPKIIVEGDFDSHSGIAIANNNMKASLAHPLGGGPKHLPFEIGYEQLDFVGITQVKGRHDTQVTIRSGTWLPLMLPGLIPSKGWFTKGLFLKSDNSLLVYQLPWEFTVIPARWVKGLSQCVDRIWVPSVFVRDAYVRSGLPDDMIDVVPHAINNTMWSPNNKPFKFPTKKKFTFLFVSGMLHRKGIDVLLEAFTKAFTAADDVSLYLHSAYSGESKDGLRMHLQILADINSHLNQVNAPEIVLDSESKLSEEEYFGLYTGADAYLLPFRGEGFALTVFEAALSSLPIITTDASPVTDFLSHETAYLIPAELEDCKLWPCSSKGMFMSYNGGSTAHPPQWWLPDVDKLAETLRHVAANPDEARRKGKEARKQMLAELGLAGRRQPYIEALQKLIEHRAKPGFIPRRIKNPICTSTVEYEFIEDDMDKADQEIYDHLADVYESTGLGDEVKEWYKSLYNSQTTTIQLNQWLEEQLPSHPGAKGANIGLCTFPNSGTSWTLNLLKGVTGVLKHTLYPKECNQSYRGMYCQPSRLGFAINETGDEPGRMPLSTDPVLVKTHMAMYGLRNSKLPSAKLFKTKLKSFDRVVRLVRHPLDNFIARVNLEVNNNRCGEDVSIFSCLGADFFAQDMERYFAWHRAMDDACKELNLPIITIIYEDMLKDTPPNLERLLKFMGIAPPETQVQHATERWKPIHKPNAQGWPGYLLKYDEALLRNISVIFHKMLHRDFKTTCLEVGKFLKDYATCITPSSSRGGGIKSAANLKTSRPSIAEKVKSLHSYTKRLYGVVDDMKNKLKTVDQESSEVATRVIQQGDEIVLSTCDTMTEHIQAINAASLSFSDGLLPKVVFVGTLRSGIRTLYDIVRHHKSFVAPGCRDTQFFANTILWRDHKDWPLSKRKALYKSFFPLPNDGLLASSSLFSMDMSTTYFEKPNVPQRVMHIDSQIGVGVLLRNPSDHFVSKWLQKVEAHSPEVQHFEETYGVYGLCCSSNDLEIIFKSIYHIMWTYAHEGKPFDCMNVFEEQLKSTNKCFKSEDGISNFKDIVNLRDCILSIKNDVSTGLYVYALSHWTDHIENPKQYFIIQSEELFDKPVATAQRLALFADINQFEAKDFHIIRSIGHLRAAHEEALVQQHDFKGCVPAQLNEFYEPFNKLLLESITQLELSPLTIDTWTHW